MKRSESCLVQFENFLVQQNVDRVSMCAINHKLCTRLADCFRSGIQ